MAAIASTATGVWSAGGTWLGGVPPAEGDTCTIENGHVVTIDSTITVGDDSATAALDILNGGELDWDNGADDVLTLKGNFYVRNGGTLTLDGSGNGANTLTVKLNYSAALAAGKYGAIFEDGAIVDCDGFNKTRSWDTLSADAASGQKVVVTTNDNSAIWNVGDEFVVGSMSEVGKAGAETDTIASFVTTSITKAGANYAFAHEENVAIINLTRNVICTSHNTGFKGYIFITNNTPADVTFDWVEFSYLGSNATNKRGVTLTSGDSANFDYCSFHHCYYGLVSDTLPSGPVALTNTVFGLNTAYDARRIDTGTSLVSCVFLGSDSWSTNNLSLETVTQSHFGNADVAGLSIAGSGSKTISDCRLYGNGFGYSAIVTPTFQDCFVDGNTTGITVGVGGSIARLDSVIFGASVANTTDISSAAIVVGIDINTIALAVAVTEGADNRVSFQAASTTHKTWKAAGSYEKQSVVKRTGTYALLMSPTSATDSLIADSTVPASSGVQIVVSAYFRKNPAYAGPNWPFLRLSGAGITAVTDTMTDVDDTWQLLVCYDRETEVLTNEGWKCFEDLGESELVATLNPETSEIEYQKPISYTKLPYSGKMYHVDFTGANLLVTPNHKLFAKQRRERGHDYPREDISKWELTPAEDVAGKWYRLKRDGVWKGQERAVFTISGYERTDSLGRHYTIEPIVLGMDEWLEFFGYWLAEGSMTHKDSRWLIQIVQHPDRHRDKMLASFGKIGLKPYISEKNYAMRVSNKQIGRYLDQFGHAHEKFVPRELMCLSQRQLRILFDALMAGDGSIRDSGQMYYFTTSKELAGNVQELALKLGWSANVTERPPEYPNARKRYIVGIFKKNQHPYVNRNETSKDGWQEYDGPVYCVTVPRHHIIYIRRGGKPVWCGNCSGTPTADGFAKVEFVAQSAGGGGAAYVDDVKMVYVAIDTGSMDFWYEGDLPPVLMATGLGAVDVWDVLESQIDISAVSMGRLVLKGLRAIRRLL